MVSCYCRPNRLIQLTNPTKNFKYKHHNINVVGTNVMKISNFFSNYGKWNSLVTQWLRLCTFTAGGMDSIPDPELKSHMPYGKKKKKKGGGKDYHIYIYIYYCVPRTFLSNYYAFNPHNTIV